MITIGIVVPKPLSTAKEQYIVYLEVHELVVKRQVETYFVMIGDRKYKIVIGESVVYDSTLEKPCMIVRGDFVWNSRPDRSDLNRLDKAILADKTRWFAYTESN